MADFKLLNERSLVVLTPQTDAAREWIEDNVMTAETQRWGKGIVIEARYATAILDALDDDGYTLEIE